MAKHTCEHSGITFETKDKKQDEIEELIHMIQILLFVLEYGSSIMCELMNEVSLRLGPTEEYSNKKYKWFLQFVEKIVNLDKPLPPMP